MKIQKGNLSFKRVDYSKLGALQKIYLPSDETLSKLTDGVDVFISSSKKDFPFNHTYLSVDAIKITARPLKLSFWEKLFGRRTVKSYFPTGNLRPLIKFDGGTLEEVIAKTVSQVK